MTTSGTFPPPRPATVQGQQHLRVRLRLTARTISVESVALAPGRPAQLQAVGHPWLAVVSRGEEVVHLARFANPFEQRSVRLDSTGPHHYSEFRQGRVVVALPFGSLTDLSRSRISVLDLERRPALRDSQELVGEFRAREKSGDGVFSVGFDQIEATREWATIGPMLGVDVPPGRFEVYRDDAEQWRWRLRAAGGSIVAASNDSFTTREQAEAETTWIRRNAADSPSVALD